MEDIVQLLVLNTHILVVSMRHTVLRSIVCVDLVIVFVNVNNLQ